MKLVHDTKRAAVSVRRKGERTVKVMRHSAECMYSDGTIVPKSRCTCGTTRHGYQNVWSHAV